MKGERWGGGGGEGGLKLGRKGNAQESPDLKVTSVSLKLLSTGREG